jgi:hypothetical protein
MLWEEDIARQHALLNNEIFAKLCRMALASKCKDSVSDLLFDVVALGFYIRLCLSKYAQTTQDKQNVFLHDNCEQIYFILFFHLSHQEEMRSGIHFTQQNVFLSGWSWALNERIFSTAVRPKIEKRMETF